MSHPLYVAFIWHQHQPLYKSRDIDSNIWGQYHLPWVRLHGTKDYLDLVLMLERYPKLHQTINLVPSLMVQLEDYGAGEAIDPYLALALTPISNLKRKDKQYIIQHFFDGYYPTLIAPHPRYDQLYQQKQNQGLAWCLANWTPQDYGDLLAWHNLAWIDPLFWDDLEIAQWLEQGKNFTLSDRQRIYSKQREIIRRIIPQHKKMQDRGQIEIMTTPYTHPILPLLADTDAAKIAVPGIALPQQRFQWVEDISRHLNIAWEMYLDHFEREPCGLWPSEQSVSPLILPYISQQGFKWLCSDEAVLGNSLDHCFYRDAAENVNQPQLLYRPYRLATEQGELAIVFRDHYLSDLIGFTYSGISPKKAADNLIEHLTAISASLQSQQLSSNTTLEEPWLVTIALDGENCWEYYPHDGMPFLATLYEQLSNNAKIKLVTVNEFIEQFPPKATIPTEKLHSGSWVDGNFTTWIGDPIKNQAWDLLTAARETLANHPEATEENNPQAWEALYAAEGSDWFWWFGEGHSSNQDAMFDQLFRQHLRAIYDALNEPIPQNLNQPVDQQKTKSDRLPLSFIQPQINGLLNKPDWEQAGKIEISSARSTMHHNSAVPRIFYGINYNNLYLRFDLKTGIKLGTELPNELHLLWYYAHVPTHSSLAPIAHLPDEVPLNYYFHHHLGINLINQSVWLQQAQAHRMWQSCSCNAEVSLDECLEIAIPWQDLNIEPNYTLEILAIFANQGEYHSYLPENKFIRLQSPLNFRN